MKRTLISVLVLLVFLAGTLFVAPSFIDWNKYKDQIISQIESVTGYDVGIGGSLEMAVLPYPHLSIENLTIAKPTAEGAPLLQIEEASVQLALAPLFSGNVEVSRVLLIGPDLRMSVGADGKPSWMTPELDARMKKGDSREDGASSDFANAIALNAITVKNGSFTFVDQRAGQTVSLKNINLEVQGESLYGPYSVTGNVEYNATKTQIKLNSGRLDQLADSIAAQLELSFPDISSTLTYSGVVAMKDRLELQGETGVETTDLSRLLKVASVSVPDYLQKPFSSKGILTFSGNEAAYRNLKIGFAGVEGNGYIVARNFSKDAKGPLGIEASLGVTKPFELEKLLPGTGKGKAAGGKAAKAAGGAKAFIPETITVPKELAGSLNVKAASVSYGGVSYNDVAFSFESREKDFGGQLSLKAPGSTIVDVNSTLEFAARSKSAQDGSVTYSEPSLKLDTKFSSGEPLKLVQPFLKKPADKGLTNLLANNLTSEGDLTIKPQTVEIKAAFVKLGETRVNASGSYSKGSKDTRDLLKVAVSNFGMDADYWMKKVNGTATAAVQTEAPKTDIRAVTKNLALPFDLDYSAEVQGLRFKGRDYTKLVSKGRLTGKQLLLDSLQLTSNAGDTLVVAGGVKDISALNGIDLSLDANIIDLEQTVQTFGFDATRLPSGIGQSQFIAELKGDPQSLGFTANLKAMRATMETAGAVADLLSAPKVSDLTLRLKHPNYVDVVRLFSPAFSGGVAIKKDLDVFASMSRKDNIYTFSQLQASVGPTSIKGDVVADVSGAKPAITAALELSDVPVDSLLGIQTSKGTVKARNVGQATQDVRWSRNAINTDLLQKANITLKATANSVSYGNWNFKNAGVNVGLKDGNIDIKQLDGGLYGGHVAMTGNLKSSPKPRQPISFAGNFIVQNVSLEEFVRSFSGSQLIRAKGPVSLNAEVKTSGLSPAALVFDLSVKGTATGQNLLFEGFDLAQLSRALAEPSSSFTQNFSRLLDASLKGGSTKFDTLDGAYTITEGVIKFDKLLLAGPEANVSTLGTVSLPLWSLDLESTVQLKEPADAPPLRASFKGPIDKPAQTFGQNAMQQFFQKQIEGMVVNPLLESLEKKTGLPSGILGGQPQRAPTQQVKPEGTSTQTTTPENGADAGTTQVQPQPPAKKQDVRPEDVFFGILEGVVKGQQ